MKKMGEPNIHELFMVQIMRTSEIVQHRIAVVLKDYELTPPQYNILRILRGAEGDLSVGEIKKRMLFETSDVSRLLDRLVKKGLANRNICPNNRRKMDVCISKIGVQVLDKLYGELAQTLNGFYEEALSKEKAQEIMEVLQRIVASEPKVLENQNN
ncbi:MAG: MarR family transcriptional regulator [Flavobacteriales bacterium]|nr:MarR family transcriptional regulator [Flavobacteriales bacterium]